jgi:hypothetical protein
MFIGVVTHFHLADWLVVLGSGTVTYQGTWADFTKDPKQILKVHINKTQSGTIEERTQVDKIVGSQSIRVADAISDLSRATGDFTLYGNVHGAPRTQFLY